MFATSISNYLLESGLLGKICVPVVQMAGPIYLCY